MNITYGITKEIYSLGATSRTAYGIVAYANANEDSTAIIVATVHDITADKQALSKLILQCNQFKLSTIHLNDVVEDFLTT